eukprot:COSAG01_NODE_883_length_12927_cov_10.710789_12_plen_197_part_00
MDFGDGHPLCYFCRVAVACYDIYEDPANTPLMMAWPDHVPIVVPIIIGTGLIPRMEELESLILYGKPVSANKRAPRKATPLMKLVAWLAMAANASWIWQLYHRETSTDFAILIVQGLVGADLCSGVYHWFQDSFRSTSESINAALFDNFQIHHECALQRHGSAPLTSRLYPSRLQRCIQPRALALLSGVTHAQCRT